MALATDRELPKSSRYEEPTTTVYLVRTFTLFYWIGLFPFHIKWSERDNCYKLITASLFRKIICIIFNFGGFLTLYAGFSLTYNLSSVMLHESYIILILTILLFTMMTISMISLLYILWADQDKILSMLNLLADPSFPLERSSRVSRLHYILPASFTLGFILSLVKRAPEKYSMAVGSQLCVTYVTSILTTLLPLNSKDIEASPILQIILSGLRGFFKVIVGFGSTYVTANMVMLLSLPVSLRKVGQNVKRIFDNEAMPVRRALLIHRHLLDISNRVNVIFGILTFLSYILCLVYFLQIPLWRVFSIEGGKASESIYDKIFGLGIILVWSIIWWAAGDWHRIVHAITFSNWSQGKITSNLTIEEHLQLISLSNSLQTNPVALSCSFFVITHQLLCQTVGALLTYGIVVLQILTPSTRHLFHETQKNILDTWVPP